MTTTMRVAMVTSRFSPLVGGIETHVAEVSRRLAQRGVAVSVFTTDLGGQLPQQERRDEVEINRFPAWPSSGDYYVSLPLIRALRSRRFDVVHVQGIHTLLPPMVLGAMQQMSVPTVLTFHTGGHSSPIRTAIRGAQWRSLRGLMRRTDELIGVCEFEIDRFSRLLKVPRSRFRLIRNGSEPLPSGTPVEPGLEGDPLILSVGRLERYKGHQRVIRSMPALLRTRPGARLVVVGTGPYEEMLRKLVRELGLTAAVSFTSYGPERRASLGALMRASDVVVLMSEYEAHPVVVMEALALGKPVVVAQTSGLAELTRFQLVTSVELGISAELLASTMLSIVRSPRPTNGDQPKLSSWDDCANELLSTYAAATGQPARC